VRSFVIDVRGGRTGAPAIAPQGLAPTLEPGPRESDPKWTEKGQFVVAVFGFGLTLLGLYLVWRQLRATYEQGLADRTAQLVERYQRHDFLAMWSRVAYGYLAADDLAECMQRIRAWDEAPHGGSKLKVRTAVRRPAPTLSEVTYAANFHEEIGVLHNTNKVSGDQLMRHFSTPFVRAFDIAWWWIQVQRGSKLAAADPDKSKGHETETYVEWQRMVRSIVAARPEVAPQPRSDVWVICRPTEVAQPRWKHLLRRPEWRRHQRLSENLTRPLGAVDALIARLPAAPLDRDTPNVVCVAPWQAPRGHQLRVRDLAVRVQALLETEDGLAKLESIAETTPKVASAEPSS
jgi:hypothetical protein